MMISQLTARTLRRLMGSSNRRAPPPPPNHAPPPNSLLSTPTDINTSEMLQEWRESNHLLRAFIRQMAGFTHNIASSNETEVTKAVYQHLLEHGLVDRETPWLVNFREYDERYRVVCECDGLIPIFTKNRAAIIEAKSHVKPEDVHRLVWRMRTIQERRGLSGCVGFLGGPRFPDEVQQLARQHDISCVLLSGQRYDIHPKQFEFVLPPVSGSSNDDERGRKRQRRRSQ